MRTEAQQFDLWANIGGTIVPRYPFEPGSKRAGTSTDAAPTPKEAATLRDQVLDALRQRRATPDELAEVLGRSVLSVRPRMSELLRLGKVRETDDRRRNASGKYAAVLEVIV